MEDQSGIYIRGIHLKYFELENKSSRPMCNWISILEDQLFHQSLHFNHWKSRYNGHNFEILIRIFYFLLNKSINILTKCF